MGRSGNLAILRAIVSAGGDVRLHDAWGKAPFHYIDDQEDPKKRKKIQRFLIGKSELFFVMARTNEMENVFVGKVTDQAVLSN